jgi:hypothetical protein
MNTGDERAISPEVLRGMSGLELMRAIGSRAFAAAAHRHANEYEPHGRGAGRRHL